jgi:hypothetical protein
LIRPPEMHFEPQKRREGGGEGSKEERRGGGSGILLGSHGRRISCFQEREREREREIERERGDSINAVQV